LCAAQTIEAEQRGDHRLLRGVGRHVGVARDPPARRHHDGVVALHEQRERAPIARAGRGHERGVVMHGRRDLGAARPSNE
jgi:hypothetical protein